MDKCVIKPRVKNKNGEYVDSELFSSLLHYTNDRELAKQYYAVGTSPEFLSRVASEAKFDSNGEITFQSLRQLTKLNLNDEKVKQTLNKDIGSGVYSYNEAMPKLQSFNRNSQYNDKYMATIINREDGRVELKVVDKNNTNTAELNNNIANRSLQERIKFYLNRAGVDYTFLDEGDRVNGRYSTVNATKTADSLYQLIRVANNEQIDSSLAEEAGHFAVGALGNSPLVQRLERLLTPDVQRVIMGDEYDTVAYRDNPAREVAGYLVGRAINGEIDKRSSWQNLVGRIVNQIKRVFNNITGNEIANARLEATRTADAIAQGFMSPGFQGTVENALETQETLYSARDSVNVATFKSVLNVLKQQASEMSAIDKSLYGKYSLLEGQVEAGRVSSQPSIFADHIAVDGITEAMDLMVDSIPEMINKLNKVDFNVASITPENAALLREVATFVSNAQALIKIVKDATTTEDSRLKLQNVNEDTINRLKTLRRNLNDAINGDDRLLSNLEVKQREFYLKFLEDALGSTYINRAARVIFDWKKGQRGLKWVSAERVPIEDLLRYMEKDISIHESILASMSNNSDVIGQLADRAVKLANKFADDMTIQTQDRLRGLEKDLHDIGVNNTDIFCEVSPRTGKLTGNIVSEYVWGDYEDDWLAFKKEARDAFYAANNLEGKSDFEKSLLWDQFFKPQAKSWHKAHSAWNKAENRWYPNDGYKSEQYRTTIAGTPKEGWLNKYMNLKRELDGFLPNGSTNVYRMPQFKGTTMNKIRNRRMTEGTGKAISYTLRRNMADTFVEDSEDRDFGSDQTYNTIEEDMFSNQLEFEKEKLNRIPIYGINKLRDSNELSTDLFHSTLAYAGMAHSYAAISNVAGTLEVGKDVLKNRAIGGIKPEFGREETSRAYKRYQKFLDKQVYGINTTKIKIGKKLVLNKVVGFFTGLASKFFLGGNVTGGMINLGTGTLEVFKEALAGEYFSIKDWERANIEYWKNLPSNWLHAGDDVKEDKVSLFIRQMNALNENKKKERDFYTNKSKLVKLNPVGENLFLPYKCGEHYMQTMAFLATANGTKLIDSNGNPITLYNAYQVVPIDERRPELGKTLAMKQGVKLLDESTGELREWNIDDEARFMDRAREINNRMHGIYNNQDKVAIQQNVYGNALLAMRGYALGMIQRRFGVNAYSVSLGGETEGSLRTLAKVIASTFTDKGGFGLTARAILLPTSKTTQQRMLNAGFSANQYYNMRRNWADMAVLAALTLLKCIAAKPDDDDDAEDDIAMGILYYVASRLYSEQAAFNTPWGLVKEAPVVTNISPVGFSLATDLANIATMFVTQEEYKSSGATYEKGDLKWQHKVERLLPYWRSYLMMQNPYQAAQGYQYGRANLVR
jgi:hypothetical protein